MLSQFTFKNFKSYKDETTLDFEAVSGQGFAESLLSDGFKHEYLPVSVIYGPNGGGKSNVLEALATLIRLVSFPIFAIRGTLKQSVIPMAPFLFNSTSANEPIEFEVFFQPGDEYEYKYSLHILNLKIVNEQLYRRKLINNGRITKLFTRDKNGIELGASISKKSINREVNDHMPYLSFLASNYNIESINSAAQWFEQCGIINYSLPAAENQIIWNNDDRFKERLISLLNDTGVDITDIVKVENEDKSGAFVYFEHTVNNNKYRLSLDLESNGTKKLFSLLPYVMKALNDGRLLIVDELDAKLHPKLLKYIIMLFKNPEVNRKKAQLVFTSHDVSTMKSSVFRTDEIWFAYKKDDESSDLYSLYELRDENGNHIGTHTAFDKQYLEGRYGADPYLKNMMDWS